MIDLVIPRGSNRLVSQIKASTKIPVLGHAGKILKLNFVLLCFPFMDPSTYLNRLNSFYSV